MKKIDIQKEILKLAQDKINEEYERFGKLLKQLEYNNTHYNSTDYFVIKEIKDNANLKAYSDGLLVAMDCVALVYYNLKDKEQPIDNSTDS
jgi:hypothetical protein